MRGIRGLGRIGVLTRIDLTVGVITSGLRQIVRLLRLRRLAVLVILRRISFAGSDAEYARIYHQDVVSGVASPTGAEAVLFRSLARELGVKVGDQLDLGFQGGTTLHLEVAGIVESADTTSEISIPLDQLVAAGVLRQDSTLSVLIAPGADKAKVRDAVDAAAASAPIVGVFDKQGFADQIRDQVNQIGRAHV